MFSRGAFSALSTFVLLFATVGTALGCTFSSPTVSCTGNTGTSVANSTGNLTKANSYPVSVAVSGITGTVTGVQVVLHGVAANGSVGATLEGSGFLLAAPSGHYLEILHAIANGLNESATLSNDVINLADSNSSLAPNQSTFLCNGGSGGTCTISGTTFNWKPSSYKDTNDAVSTSSGSYPSPAPPNGVAAAASTPATLDSATFASVFSGDSPNGTWSLYLEDDNASDAVSFTSWDLILTVSVASTSTTTTLTSSVNPSFTSAANNTTTFTATVTGGSGPTGTVTFAEGSTNLTCSGGNPATLSSGAATCSTSFTTEGIHNITATYNPTGSFLTSNGSLNQFVKNHSKIVSGAYCNQGSISSPSEGNTTPYPSVINVGTDTTALTNSLSTLTVTLNGLSTTAVGGLSSLSFLLASPGGSHALEFLSFAGGAFTIPSAINLTLSDSATTGLVPADFSSSPTGSVTYLPTAYTSTFNNVFPSPPSPAPAPPGTFGIAATEGNPGAPTFTSTFDGASGNGDWTLYAFNFNNQSVTISGGWCMNFTQSTGTPTTTTVTGTPNRSNTGATVTVTATVLNANTSAPITSGTVTFTANGVSVPGGPTSPVTVNSSGQASFTTSALPEGDNPILATYNGTGSFSLSFGSYTQRVDDTTTGPTISGNVFTYCNTGAITLPGPNNASDIGQASPNPSNIFVTDLPGTIQAVQVDLKSLHMQDTDHFTASLLVGPAATTASTFDFFSNTGSGAGTISGNFSFADSAASLVPSGSDPASGTYKPTSYGSADTFFASTSGFFTLPSGPYNRAATAGTSTFASIYQSDNGQGTWSLYFNQNTHAASNGLTGGWCLDLTVNPPVLTITKTHTGPGTGNAFVAGQTGTYTITVGNSGPGSTNGQTVTVSDTLPSGLTQSSVNGGADWNCSSSTSTAVTCTSTTAISSGGSFPAITVTVTPALTSGTSASNTASVSGSGMTGATSTPDVATIIHPPVLSVGITDNGSPAGTFKQDETGNTATVTVSNASSASGAGPTTSAVTVTFTISNATAIVPQSITPPGSGWTCQPVAASFTCSSTASPALAAGGSAQFTLNFNVSASATSPQSIAASVSGGGGNSPSATDSLTIIPVPVLAITKSHTGNFTQGSTDNWSLQVTNTSAAGSTTSGTTTVVDTLPSGYTLSTFGGTGWSCSGTTTVTCTSTASVAGAGGTFPVLTLTVNVPANSPVSATNNASAYGGGDPVHNSLATAATGSDTATVVQVPASITVVTGTTPQSATVNSAFGTLLAVTVKDAGGVVIPSVTITFTAPGTGASGTFLNGTVITTAMTNASGIATASTFTANGTAGGPYNVTAATPNSLSTFFSLTNNGIGPVVTTQPLPQTVCAGGTATFTAAASGNPAPTVQWQVSTNGGTSFSNISGATSTTLSITGTTAAMNNNQYRAVFTNSVTSVNSNAVALTVNTAPVVSLNPLSQSIVSGLTVTFTAAATGTPAPTVQWQVSTNGGTSFSNISGATSTTLSFLVSASQNNNQYRAVFTNSCSAVNTSAATLTVTTAAGPSVVSFSVQFGIESYNVIGTSRNRLPWDVTGIQVVFSAPITSGNINSLTGVTPTGFSGLGTTTLTWTITPISLGNVAAVLAGSGPNALTDSNGNGLGSGAGFTQNFRVLWGDFNDDGIVNSADTVGVNNAISQPYNILADVNGDGVVNSTDVRLVRSLLGASLP